VEFFQNTFFSSIFRIIRKSQLDLENDFFFIAVHRDQKDIPDHQEGPDHQEEPGNQGVLEPRALPALKVLPDPRVLQGAWNVTGNSAFINIWTSKKTLAYSW
jgi:hypothetical protein